MRNKILFNFKIRIGGIVNGEFDPNKTILVQGTSTEDFMRNLDHELEREGQPKLDGDSRVSLYNKLKDLEEKNINEQSMKKFIKTKLNEMLNIPTEVGGKEDLEILDIVKAKPYVEILSHVANDWGRDSSLYSNLSDLFIHDKLNLKKLIRILVDYDVYDDYSHLLNLNEKTN